MGGVEPHRPARRGDTPMRLRNILWWCCFLPLALVAQMFVPGVDLLVVGLIIALQERDGRTLCWLAPLLVILQEGIGSFAFGGMLLWYAAVAVLVQLGHWLFEVENFLFMLLLGACLGATHWCLMHVLCALQNATLDPRLLLVESLMQAAAVPVLWRIASWTRKWMGRYALQPQQ